MAVPCRCFRQFDRKFRQFGWESMYFRNLRGSSHACFVSECCWYVVNL